MTYEYFRCLDDIRFEGRWQLGEPISASGDVDPSRFTTGQVYDGPRDLTLDREDGVPLDFTLAAFDVPVVSERIATILRELCPCDIQIIPIGIEGEEVGYAILNVLSTVACLNEEKSVFTKWTDADGRNDKLGQYRMVAKLVVDHNKTEGAEIFRIDGWDVPLIVSKRIKEGLEQQGCVGSDFECVS